jgi:hypothetical protein
LEKESQSDKEEDNSSGALQDDILKDTLPLMPGDAQQCIVIPPPKMSRHHGKIRKYSQTKVEDKHKATRPDMSKCAYCGDFKHIKGISAHQRYCKALHDEANSSSDGKVKCRFCEQRFLLTEISRHTKRCPERNKRYDKTRTRKTRVRKGISTSPKETASLRRKTSKSPKQASVLSSSKRLRAKALPVAPTFTKVECRYCFKFYHPGSGVTLHEKSCHSNPNRIDRKSRYCDSSEEKDDEDEVESSDASSINDNGTSSTDHSEEDDDTDREVNRDTTNGSRRSKRKINKCRRFDSDSEEESSEKETDGDDKSNSEEESCSDDDDGDEKGNDEEREEEKVNVNAAGQVQCKWCKKWFYKSGLGPHQKLFCPVKNTNRKMTQCRFCGKLVSPHGLASHQRACLLKAEKEKKQKKKANVDRASHKNQVKDDCADRFKNDNNSSYDDFDDSTSQTYMIGSKRRRKSTPKKAAELEEKRRIATAKAAAAKLSSNNKKRKRPSISPDVEDDVANNEIHDEIKDNDFVADNRKFIYKAMEGSSTDDRNGAQTECKPIYGYVLELFSAVCNNAYVNSIAKGDPKIANHPHCILDTPIPFGYTVETEPEKERLMRLQVRCLTDE